MPITTLLFDVHRTLVDDSGFPRQFIWNLIQAAGAAVPYTDYQRRYSELVTRLFDWPSINPFISIREIHRKRLMIMYREFGVKRNIEADLDFLWNQMGTSQIYPEVPPVLNVVTQHYRCGLVSNADDDDPLIQILHNNGYQFDCVVTSEQVKCYKPDARIFTHALSKLHCTPHEALLVGDSPVADILGARNAGIKMVWLNRLQQVLAPEYPAPQFEIQDLTQLFPVLKQLT